MSFTTWPVTTITIGSNEQRHAVFSDRRIRLSAEQVGFKSGKMPVSAWSVVEWGVGAEIDYHQTPGPDARVYFILAGTVQITLGDGETRTFGPGECIYYGDAYQDFSAESHQGHKTIIVNGPVRAVSLVVPVADLEGGELIFES